MYNIIELFIKNLKKEQIKEFAIKKGANLSDEELDFTYNFIKNNYSQVLRNPDSYNLNLYKDHYSPKNFLIIQEIIDEYYQKFKIYL